MISRQSFNNGRLFIDALKRFKWFSILFGVLLFLGMPLTIWMSLGYTKTSQPEYWAANLQAQYLPSLLFNPLMMMLIIATSILLGISLYNYLYNERACNFFFSLPIQRARLYIEHLGASSVLLTVPILINGFLSFLVFNFFGIKKGAWFAPEVTQATMGTIPATNTINLSAAFWYWLGLTVLMMLFFLVFAIFCGMFTGNFIMQGGLAVLGMFLPLGIYSLVQANLWKLLYGYSTDWGSDKIAWFSPIVTYFQQASQPRGNITVFFVCYLLVVVAMIIISLVLLKLRKAESTGDTLAAEWMRYLFKFGAAACSALALGIYFGAIYVSNNWVLYIGYLAGAILGLIVADMVAYKSFRFFEHWKSMVVFIIGFFVVIGGVKLDLTGYEKRIPEVASVESVELDTLSWRSGLGEAEPLKDPQTIQLITNLHEKIVANKHQNIVAQFTAHDSGVDANGIYKPYNIVTFTVEYNLKNGRTLRRSYTIDQTEYRSELEPIYTTKEVRTELMKPIFPPYKEKIERLSLTNYRFNRSVVIYRPEEVQLAIKALQLDAMKLSYEAAFENKVPILASIDVGFFQNSVPGYPIGSIQYYSEFANFTKFLRDYGYEAELFITPESVASIELKRNKSPGFAKTYTTPEEIKEILAWASMTQGEKFAEDDPNGPAYGTITLKDGSKIQIIVGIESPIIKDLLQTNSGT